MIRIPKTDTNGQPMMFYHVTSDTDWKEISRRDFFDLVRTTPDAENHVLPDFDGTVVFFVPDGE